MNAYYAPPNLRVAFFAEHIIVGSEEDVRESVRDVDLVVSLGGVDLERLSQLLPPNQAALCVLGRDDAEVQPPRPFKALHGGGVTFRDWRIAGLSGALRSTPGPGFYIDEREAEGLLEAMPSCDLLISYLPSSLTDSRHGLEALSAYIVNKEPIYCFHAHQGRETEDRIIGEGTWDVGVSGMLVMDDLRFL